MKILISHPAIKQAKKLDKKTQDKFKKQILQLINDPKHPSLHMKKMAGINCCEARIDRKYRFAFDIINDQIIILSVGMHDTGLGKK